MTTTKTATDRAPQPALAQSAYLDIVWETRGDGLIEGRVADQRYTIKPAIDGSYSAKVLDKSARTGWSEAVWGCATIDAAKAWCQERRDIEMARRGEI